MDSLKGTAFKMPPDVGGFEQEMYLCRWMEANLPEGQKKTVVMLRTIYPLCPKFMRDNFFKKALVSSNTLGYVKKVIARSKKIQSAVQAIIDRGDHGMIFHGEVLHGVNLKANPKWLGKKDGKWTIDQEEDISKEAIKLWMIKNRFRTWSGKIVLFADFGFSGIPFSADWKVPDDDWEQLQAIWKKEDAERVMRELAEQMEIVNREHDQRE